MAGELDGSVLDALVQVGTLVFVVSSMAAMGLGLTVAQIAAPLRNVRLVALALVANFVVVPLVAVGLQAAIGLDDALYAGLLLVATAAGAPFLPKLVEAARGDVAFSVGLMVLLMVVTVVFMPVALPLLVDGVSIAPWDIASSLVFLMLVPLAVGLVARAVRPDMAATIRPHLSQASSLALVVLVVAGVVANFSDIVGLIGTGGIVAIVAFVALAFAAGFAAGGRDRGHRIVTGCGTAQRNLSAALVVAAQNFTGTPATLTFVIVAALIGLVGLLAAAAAVGRSAGPDAAAPA